MKATTFLSSKPRCEILDGFRSVDFFFALSGFGVAYAFSRLYDIPVRQWLTERILKRSER